MTVRRRIVVVVVCSVVLIIIPYDVGCSNRTVVIDGSFKLTRAICSVHLDNIGSEIPDRVLNYTQGCPYSPRLGRRNKFCELHQAGGGGGHRGEKRPFSPFDVGQFANLNDSNFPRLPQYVIDKSACKKASAVPKFYDTTAGLFLLARPCGVIVSTFEMFTAESITQAVIALYIAFKESPEEMKCVFYDRGCELHKYLVDRKLSGAFPGWLLDNVVYGVDRLHIKNHTTRCCTLGDPLCAYHPDLPKFKEYLGNTTVCEQVGVILVVGGRWWWW